MQNKLLHVKKNCYRLLKKLLQVKPSQVKNLLIFLQGVSILLDKVGQWELHKFIK